ncbi:MAG: hypothetical protein RSB77_04725 [Bacilli bacterium]
MKYFKNNKILVLVLFIILAISARSISNNIREFNMNVDSYNYRINECNTTLKNDKFYFESCKGAKEWGGPKRTDAFFTFFDILFDDKFTILHLLLPFLIIMCTIEKLNQKLKSGYIKNELMRKKYSTIILNEWLCSIKKLWIIPLLFTIIFIASYLLTGNFNYKSSLLNYEPWVNPIFFDNIFFSIIIYLFNFLLHGIFIINIGYIMTKKSKGYILSVLSSFIMFLGAWAFSETFFGYLISGKLFGKPEFHNYFSFTTLWGYPEINNFIMFTLYQFILALISSIFVYKLYKNREEVLIANE